MSSSDGQSKSPRCSLKTQPVNQCVMQWQAGQRSFLSWRGRWRFPLITGEDLKVRGRFWVVQIRYLRTRWTAFVEDPWSTSFATSCYNSQNSKQFASIIIIFKMIFTVNRCSSAWFWHNVFEEFLCTSR